MGFAFRCGTCASPLRRPGDPCVACASKVAIASSPATDVSNDEIDALLADFRREASTPAPTFGPEHAKTLEAIEGTRDFLERMKREREARELERRARLEGRVAHDSSKGPAESDGAGGYVEQPVRVRVKGKPADDPRRRHTKKRRERAESARFKNRPLGARVRGAFGDEVRAGGRVAGKRAGKRKPGPRARKRREAFLAKLAIADGAHCDPTDWSNGVWNGVKAILSSGAIAAKYTAELPPVISMRTRRACLEVHKVHSGPDAGVWKRRRSWSSIVARVRAAVAWALYRTARESQRRGHPLIVQGVTVGMIGALFPNPRDSSKRLTGGYMRATHASSGRLLGPIVALSQAGVFTKHQPPATAVPERYTGPWHTRVNRRTGELERVRFAFNQYWFDGFSAGGDQSWPQWDHELDAAVSALTSTQDAPRACLPVRATAGPPAAS